MLIGIYLYPHFSVMEIPMTAGLTTFDKSGVCNLSENPY